MAKALRGKYKQKDKYLSQKQIDNIEAAIYNDKLHELYKEVDDTPIPKKLLTEDVKKNIIKGQRYAHIDGQEEYIILEDGRLINLENINQLQIQFTGVNLRGYAKKNRIVLHEEFAKNGWKYDRDNILRAYKKNKWKIYVNYASKSLYESI